MKIKKLTKLDLKFEECDITTSNGNFYIKVGDNYILVHNSPAIFFGEDPRKEHKGKFFVATKSAFSAGNPKISHTNEDIDKYYGNSSLNVILKNCLQAFSRSYDSSGLIYQGDLLFSTPEDKKINTIDGIQYLTFKPNMLVYAIPVDNKSDLFQRASQSQVGIILHDSFFGVITNNAVSTRPAGKNFEKIKLLGKQNNVFIEDSTYPSINLKFNIDSRIKIIRLLQQCKEYAQEISQDFDEKWKSTPLLGLIKMFLNYQVKNQAGMFKTALSDKQFNVKEFKVDFKNWISRKFSDEVEKKKTEGGKISTMSRRDALFAWIDDNVVEFDCLLHATYCMLLIKNELLNIINDVEDKIGKTFYQAADGSFKAAKGEGFVLFLGSNQVKLVDRLSFSYLNFQK